MSNIRDIPDVKKAIIVPISAVKELDRLWEDYKETEATILPYNRCDTSIDDWEELCKRLHYVIAYFIHANDLSTSEAEKEICFAMDQFAKKNNLPKHDWDTEYEDQYEESRTED